MRSCGFPPKTGTMKMSCILAIAGFLHLAGNVDAVPDDHVTIKCETQRACSSKGIAQASQHFRLGWVPGREYVYKLTMKSRPMPDREVVTTGVLTLSVKERKYSQFLVCWPQVVTQSNGVVFNSGEAWVTDRGLARSSLGDDVVALCLIQFLLPEMYEERFQFEPKVLGPGGKGANVIGKVYQERGGTALIAAYGKLPTEGGAMRDFEIHSKFDLEKGLFISSTMVFISTDLSISLELTKVTDSVGR